MRRGTEFVGVVCLASGGNSPAAAYVEFRGKNRIASGCALQCMGICCRLGNASATAQVIMERCSVQNASRCSFLLISDPFKMRHYPGMSTSRRR
jgi:hypothetical protein